MGREPNDPPDDEKGLDATTPEVTEIAALRRELERRLARLESRLDGLEEMTAAIASGSSRRAGIFGLTRAVPVPQPLPRRLPRPAAASDVVASPGAEGSTEGPQFEQGLDVPTASNWSRPLLVVTGGVTLFFFLLVQLFCAAPAPPPRKPLRPPRAAPAQAPAAAKAPPGTLFVTPSSEPEGTEAGTPRPKPERPPG